MQRLLVPSIALVLLASACSEPKCPSDMIQIGDTCYRCDAGFSPDDNQCQAIEPGTQVEGDAETLDSTIEAVLARDGGAEASQSTACYLDLDGDGAGAGASISCPPDLMSNPRAGLSTRGDDCDDKDPARSPTLSDVCDDKIDNDCDLKVDDEANNPCGGPCSVKFEHQPGEACNNGKLGVCKAEGVYKCSGDSAVVCGAEGESKSGEICGDSLDNDCDGAADEADAIDATTWYQDCDGDGYAATDVGSKKGCVKPAATSEACKGWTSVAPSAGTKTNWDCDDTRVGVRAGERVWSAACRSA